MSTAFPALVGGPPQASAAASAAAPHHLRALTAGRRRTAGWSAPGAVSLRRSTCAHRAALAASGGVPDTERDNGTQTAADVGGGTGRPGLVAAAETAEYCG